MQVARQHHAHTQPQQQQQAPQPDVNAELLYCIDGLGTTDDDTGVFHASPYVTESLKGIEQLLRRDPPSTQPVHHTLGEWCTAQTHLLPLLVSYRDDKNIVFRATKLLVRLTLPLGPDLAKHRVVRTRQQQAYKEAIVGSTALAALIGQLEGPLATELRDDDDRQDLELILTLFKNLLQVPNPAAERLTSDSRQHLQDKCILAFRDAHILETFIVLANHIRREKTKSSLNLLLLDIFYHLYKHEQPAALLNIDVNGNGVAGGGGGGVGAGGGVGPSHHHDGGKYASQSSSTEASVAKQRANAALRRATEQLHTKRSHVELPSRHSRFGTNIYKDRGQLQNHRNQFIRNPFADTNFLPSDLLVRRPLKPPVPDPPTRVYLNDDVRQTLDSTAHQFMQYAYTTLMASVKSDLCEDTTTTTTKYLPEDYTNFMFVTGFFMEYHRLYSKLHPPTPKSSSSGNSSGGDKENSTLANLNVGVSTSDGTDKNNADDEDEDMSDEARARREAATKAAAKAAKAAARRAAKEAASHYYDGAPVYCTLDTTTFKFVTERIDRYCAKPVQYQSLEPAAYMYREYVRGLYELANHGIDEQSREEGHKLRCNAFYQSESIDIVFNLVKQYEPHRNAKHYLRGLIMSVHFVMRNLSQLAKQKHFVLGRRRKVRRKRLRKSVDPDEYDEEEEYVGTDEETGDAEGGAGDDGDELEKNTAGKKQGQQAPIVVSGSGAAAAPADSSSSSSSAAATATVDDDGMTTPVRAPSSSRVGAPVVAGDITPDTDVEPTSTAKVKSKASEPEAAVLDPNMNNGLMSVEAAVAAGVKADGAEAGAVVVKTAAQLQEEEAAAAAAERAAVLEAEEQDRDDVYERQEKQFEFDKVLLRYAHSHVIKNYAFALADYKTNSYELNQAIVRLFERLGVEKHLEPMFFQLSLFTLFNSVLADSSIARKPAFTQLLTFVKYITRTFFKFARDQPMLFVEALFWKTYLQADVISHPNAVVTDRQAALDHKDRRKKQQEAEQQFHDDSDDSEAELDGVAPLMSRAEAWAAWDRVSTKPNRTPWRSSEEEVLRLHFETYAALPTQFAILSTMMKARTAKQVEHRLKAMGITRGRPRPRRVAPAAIVLADRLGAVQACVQSLYRNKCHHLVLWFCLKLEFALDTYDALADGETMQDFAMVPLMVSAFEHLQQPPVIRLMHVLEFVEPDFPAGISHWRIPGGYTHAQLTEMRDMLQRCYEEAPAQCAAIDKERAMAALAGDSGAGDDEGVSPIGKRKRRGGGDDGAGVVDADGVLVAPAFADGGRPDDDTDGESEAEFDAVMDDSMRATSPRVAAADVASTAEVEQNAAADAEDDDYERERRAQLQQQDDEEAAASGESKHKKKRRRLRRRVDSDDDEDEDVSMQEKSSAAADAAAADAAVANLSLLSTSAVDGGSLSLSGGDGASEAATLVLTGAVDDEDIDDEDDEEDAMVVTTMKKKTRRLIVDDEDDEEEDDDDDEVNDEEY